MLLYVVNSIGSSPGRTGFMMAVTATGETDGSIGGGIMEHKFVEMAKACLMQSREPVLIHRQLHDKKSSADQSGMICSGEQTNLLYVVKQEDMASIEALIHSMENYQNGTLEISNKGIQFFDSIIDSEPEATVDFIYREKTGFTNQLFIIGGGHCALALSQLISRMDFYIHVLDDRKQLPTLEENKFIHQKTLLKSYGEVGAHVPAGKHAYVVIMTEGYRTDAVALASLLGREFKYLGLLGSSSKVKKMFADMMEKGLSPELLKTIHAPIGIAINSQTPEEIAVSIAAEIIAVKNREG